MSDLPGLLEVIANNTVSEVRLNPETLAVLLYALDKISNAKTWLDYRGEYMSEADIELIHELVDLAADDIMRPIAMTPVGGIMMWLDDEPPEDWFWLDGGGVLKADYPELFALYGGRYALTTDFFGLPNWRGRSPFGSTFVEDNDVLDGALTTTLSTAQIPAHNHAVTDPGHFHDHIRAGGAAGGAYTNVAGTTATSPVNVAWPTQSKVTGISIQNAGGGSPHNNLHPVVYCMYIVYAGRKAT